MSTMSIATIVNSVRGILIYCKSIVNMGLRDARVLKSPLQKGLYTPAHVKAVSFAFFASDFASRLGS